jgi:bifunctional non-homologous end joining protein LigD
MAEKIEIGGHSMEISNAEKLLFPGDKISKGDVVDYYRRIAGVMLPYLEGRPLTMHRFPDGIGGEGFYQQAVSDYFPKWIERAPVKKEGGEVSHVVCNNAATLVYLANQACITPHVWLSRQDQLHHPDLLVFDLDPPDDDFAPVRDAALMLRELLDELGLKSFLKTTGSRGLHVTVPLDRSSDFDEVRALARQIARVLVKRQPQRLTDEQRKEKRGQRVFVDTLRNSYGQTAVAPYALRAKPGAPVAAPLAWEELRDGKLHARSYNLNNIFRRLAQKKDPWRGIWKSARSLKPAKERLEALEA